VDVLRESPIRSDTPTETVTLVPLGCARLRMGCLPVVSDAPEAQAWKARVENAGRFVFVEPGSDSTANHV
jgi:hypothetical protein